MKFIAIGELMLRLSPPNYEKIVSTHSYVVNYGGAEANVAVSLANLGVDSTFFTVLPNSDIGKSAINYFKANDVHTKHIIKADGRMGVYYLEEGVSVRPAALLSENEFMTIAVTDSNGTQSSDIFSNIESYTSENRNICCYLALPDEVENAHELGLSYGKYRAFLELQAVKPDITPEDIQNMTMREIRDLTASLSSDGEADTEEDINGEYNNNSNGSGSGNGYGHGNGNGSGNGYRHGQE